MPEVGDSDFQDLGSGKSSTVSTANLNNVDSINNSAMLTLFSETAPAATAPKAAVSSESEKPEKSTEPQISIEIEKYEKRGEGMNAYIAFKVLTKVAVQSGRFSKKEYAVWRRFSDFLGLHDKLTGKYLTSGHIVPPAPQKSVIGKTKMAKGTVEDDPYAAEFLERRRASLERYLRRLVMHPLLFQDIDFYDFITNEAELPKATQTATFSGASVKKFLERMGDSLSKITIKMEENDAWFNDKQYEIEQISDMLKKLHSDMEMLVCNRKGNSFSICMHAACEENTSLSRAISLLAETLEKVSLNYQDQTEKDFFIICETVRDYVGIADSIKEVFYERVKVWQVWQHAQQALTKKREAKCRLELAGRTDKIPLAAKDVEEAGWEAKVNDAEIYFEEISKTIRAEWKRFDMQRIKDLKQMMILYMESLSASQQQLAKYWESFLPAAKAIV
ncbi:unnamed protein product [Soboliphyme baturini]|uniref:PX domain-containing protein n=1 Tax=Soboliphyme baturini TaxID=241478 RepID=A0A183IXJ3_9BILA|nr:unnamed protein product [Soboliphyme baturini]